MSRRNIPESDTIVTGLTYDEARENPTNKTYATDSSVKFNYDLDNAPRNQKVLLLLSSGIAMLGPVTGNPERDSDIWGYFRAPVRDKELEIKLGLVKIRDEQPKQ